jgi:hypothetical protein
LGGLLVRADLGHIARASVNGLLIRACSLFWRRLPLTRLSVGRPAQRHGYPLL